MVAINPDRLIELCDALSTVIDRSGAEPDEVLAALAGILVAYARRACADEPAALQFFDHVLRNAMDAIPPLKGRMQ